MLSFTVISGYRYNRLLSCHAMLVDVLVSLFRPWGCGLVGKEQEKGKKQEKWPEEWNEEKEEQKGIVVVVCRAVVVIASPVPSNDPFSAKGLAVFCRCFYCLCFCIQTLLLRSLCIF